MPSREALQLDTKAFFCSRQNESFLRLERGSLESWEISEREARKFMVKRQSLYDLRKQGHTKP